MNVWKTTPVSETPSIVLTDWAIIELEDGDRHFAGWNTTEGEGRTSSKIVTFDKETMRGVTRSGRVYELAGMPGLNSDASYTLGCWCVINEVQDYKNISKEML